MAGVMRAFLSAWVDRIKGLGDPRNANGLVGLERVAEEGADIADVLLTMAIRGIDYTPPIHITFGDFLSAMLTADTEVRADDCRYNLRTHLLTEMAAYGIEPSAESDDGRWDPAAKLIREGSHLGGLQTDPTEMFRHIWNNRGPDRLNLDTDAFNRVASVRPCVRVSPDDGFQIRETVVEWVQYLKVTADKLPAIRPAEAPIHAFGRGGAVGGGIDVDPRRVRRTEIQASATGCPAATRRGRPSSWQDRIRYLWEGGYLGGLNRSASLASFHLQRVLEPAPASDENEAAADAKPSNDE